MLTAGVAVDKATLDFDMIFSYRIPEEFEEVVKVGSIVAVPFGKGNKLRLGIVLKLEEQIENKKLKWIVDAKNEETVITEYTFSLIQYLKEYTFCTWYDAVKAVAPFGALYSIKNGKLVSQITRTKENIYCANTEFNEKLRSDKQKAVMNFIKDGFHSRNEIMKATDTTKSVLDGLVKKGAVIIKEKDKSTTAYEKIKKCHEGKVTLTDEQEKVYRDISNTSDNKTHLIYGVTSSGKTRIFIALIQDVLEKGGSAMVLVPEISLTPQMIKLMKEYFGDTVSVIHSKLNHTERLLQYNKAKNGQAKVVVGTRSAVFTPLENLKLIIIDEEHDKSFKSENSPRYSAIKVAQLISKNTKARLVLSSATPSIESYYLAQNGLYHLHKLTRRYNDMPKPNVKLLDLGSQIDVSNDIVSNFTLDELKSTIKNGKQGIVLINRRGYSTIGICQNCRKVLKCENCSVNLVHHKKENKLVCHYCGKTYPVIMECPECGGTIYYGGYGTQRVSEYIQSNIPEARVLRMDTDTTQQNDSHEEMLEAFGKKEYDILVGTQMVAKGLDFEDVDLVCILGVDGMFNNPSYTANEQAFDLVAQVVGRAGRHSRNSRAVIETYDSGNRILIAAAHEEYEEFYEEEISFRKLNIYPPFCSMVTVAFSNTKENIAARDARVFLEIIKKVSKEYEGMPLIVLGPVPFVVEMVNNVYRWKLTLKCKNNKKFREFLNKVLKKYLSDKENKSSVYININPSQE